MIKRILSYFSPYKTSFIFIWAMIKQAKERLLYYIHWERWDVIVHFVHYNEYLEITISEWRKNKGAIILLFHKKTLFRN